eukprot:scaffold1019_cov338-Pavlova_lutheri.AAC.15
MHHVQPEGKAEEDRWMDRCPLRGPANGDRPASIGGMAGALSTCLLDAHDVPSPRSQRLLRFEEGCALEGSGCAGLVLRIRACNCNQ